MRMVRYLTALSIVLVSLVSFTRVAWAYPTYLTVFKTTYDVKKGSTLDTAGCTVCHISKFGGNNFNPYGADVKKALTNANTRTLTKDILLKLDELDSDNDGVFNIDEIKADTLPGDQSSMPTKVTRLHINALTPVPTIDKLDTAFGTTKFHPIMQDTNKLADLRLAIAGEYLAMQTKVYDRRVTPDTPDWDDAVLEIATSVPKTTVIHRLVFQPKGGDAGMVTLYQDAEKQPATIIWHSSLLKDGGFQIDALIPLTLLSIDPATPTFLFEAATTAMVKTGGNPLFGSLFGSAEGLKENTHFGTIYHPVKEPVAAP